MAVTEASNLDGGETEALTSRPEAAIKSMNILLDKYPQYVVPRKTNNKNHIATLNTDRAITLYAAKAYKENRND